MSLSENERWLLSFYRSSEITGALFFGRLAQYISNEKIKHDLSKHFADESQHGWLWTKTLQDLNSTPLDNFGTYQDKYFEHIGVPTNIMEILAITSVFERRVINQYRRHLQVKNLNPEIQKTLKLIMIDEGWHINWVSQALTDLESEFGKEEIQKTLKRYEDADNDIFSKFLVENDQRVKELFGEIKRWKI